MNLKKLCYRLLYLLTGNKKFKKRYKETWGVNNKLIIVDENGNKKEYPPEYEIKLKWLNVHWYGSNNVVTVEMPVEPYSRLEIFFTCNDNNVSIGKKLKGSFTLHLFNGGNNVKIGDEVVAGGLDVTLNSGDLTIGNDCMISFFTNILTDGHSVFDKNTKELLNNKRADIRIGNHVWIGYGATLLKNTKIKDNSIVANSAVVTKPFEEENIVIAGNPAKIVKTGINWDKLAPVDYYRDEK